MTITVKRMWEGGPLRQFSDTYQDGLKSYQSPILTGYAGAYVCDECQEPGQGVYYVRAVGKWLCGACKRKVRRSVDTAQTPA